MSGQINTPQETVNVEKILDCDVLIVGAGAAGAATAYHMAIAGLNVKVIEKQLLPLSNQCGYFVSPGALKELQKIGVTTNPGYKQANRVEGATIYLNGEALNQGAFPEIRDLPKYALVFPDKLLDNLILKAAETAGAKVEDQTRFVNSRLEKDWVTVVAKQKGEMRTYRARLLVGADGANSTVARILKGAEWSKVERALVARGYFENVAGAADEANAYFNSDCLPGYSWLFPASNDEANVGIGVALGGNPEPENPEALLKKLIETDEGMKLRLQNAKLKGKIEVKELNLYDPQMPLIGDRVMLVGLAAGLVNPFNGEGIQMGLQSAKYAADTAKWCMQNSNFSRLLLSGYPRRLNYEFGGGFKVSALILGLMRNRNLNDTWLQWINYMGQKTRTDTDYRSLISAVLSGMVFPDEETAIRAFLGSLEEAVRSSGLNSFVNRRNADAAESTEQIKVGGAAQYVAQNPLTALLWGVETVSKAVGVTASLSKRVFKETETSKAANNNVERP